MIVDAKDAIAGRVATEVAKRALLGEKVDIINCEFAVISGSKRDVLSRFKQKADRGVPLRGPYIHRAPERLMRRIVRGMLPYKQPRGRDAFKKVMCWRGVPDQFKDSKAVKFGDSSKLPTFRFVTLGEVSKHLGGKVD